MFLIDALMNKMNCNSFDREQLDVIEKYNKKDDKLSLYIIYILFIALLINFTLDNSMFSNVIGIVTSIILIIVCIYYAYFKITKQKHIVSELRGKE